jgi:hypothetical protein
MVLARPVWRGRRREGREQEGSRTRRRGESPHTLFRAIPPPCLFPPFVRSESRDGLVELPEQFAYVCRLLKIPLQSTFPPLWRPLSLVFATARASEGGREGGRGGGREGGREEHRVVSVALSILLGGLFLLCFWRYRRRTHQAP